MKLNTLFTITGVVMIFFGGGFILLPTMVFSMYGVTLDANGIMLAHVAGAAVFALGVLAWLFRKNSDIQTGRWAATTLFTFFVIKTIVTLLAQLDGVFNVMGWSIVALDTLFVLGYVYFLFIKGITTSVLATDETS